MIDAIDVLQRAIGCAVAMEDAGSLVEALPRVVETFGPDVAGDVAEQVLRHELEELTWPPMAGVAFVRLALTSTAPSVPLLRVCTTYLSLYFQELDATIARSRAVLDQGGDPRRVASDLVRAIDSLE